MHDLSLHLFAPGERLLPPDRRQSPAALAIRRGVCRRLRAEGYALVPELTLACGRRADLAAVGPSAKIALVEIKISLADLKADGKWPDYLRYADLFYFATAPGVAADAFPAQAGLIVADSYGAEIVRPARLAKLAAATRKQMLIAVARASALRLHDLEDPEAGRGCG